MNYAPPRTHHIASSDGSVKAAFLRGPFGVSSTVTVTGTKHHVDFDPQSKTEVQAWAKLLDQLAKTIKTFDQADAVAATHPEADPISQLTPTTEAPAKVQVNPLDENMVADTDLDNGSQTTYCISTAVYKQIHDKIGKHQPELGGMLGGSRKDRTITHFHFDAGADTSGGTYSPDTNTLNQVLSGWNDQGIDLVGMVHSHPKNFMHPSYGDEIYAKAFLKACKDMDAFFMPIVQSERNGQFAVNGYVVSRRPSGHHRLAPVDYRLI